MIAKTPLYASHKTIGAKMVDFHGWEMPLHYGSQLEEHQFVREQAGMFDVSHMTIVDVLGAGGRQFLRKLLTNDVDAFRNLLRWETGPARTNVNIIQEYSFFRLGHSEFSYVRICELLCFTLRLFIQL